MSGVKELLVSNENGTISFGDYELEQKKKLSDVEIRGDLYKVKTFKELTKLEKNGMLLYESDPGTAVRDFKQDGENLSFTVEMAEDTQIILGLGEDTAYRVSLNGEDAGEQKTGMGGKLIISLEKEASAVVEVNVEKV